MHRPRAARRAPRSTGMYRLGWSSSVGELATATRPSPLRTAVVAAERYSTSVGPSNTDGTAFEARRGYATAFRVRDRERAAQRHDDALDTGFVERELIRRREMCDTDSGVPPAGSRLVHHGLPAVSDQLAATMKPAVFSHDLLVSLSMRDAAAPSCALGRGARHPIGQLFCGKPRLMPPCFAGSSQRLVIAFSRVKKSNP